MNDLLKNVTENLTFVLEFLAVIVALFLVAVILEKLAQKKQGVSERIFNTRKMAMIGIPMSADGITIQPIMIMSILPMRPI